MLRIATKAVRPALTAKPALYSATSTAVARRHSSHDSHNHGHEHDHGHKAAEEHHVFEEEGFNSPWWKYSIGAIGVLYLMSKYDDYIERSGKVHPLTKFYASIMTDRAENRRIFSEYQKDVAKVAEYNILQWEEKATTAGAMESAVYYKRQAKWGSPVGTSVDMSSASHRTPVKE
ncbi:hypothetical protein GGI07_004290 [Coemansia sp. Benny D115]|nr:hypothetical protein GGI07_004290 [Coemansia sp. Benny D115]